MEFIDLHRQQKKIQDDLSRRIASVLSHGKYIMGPEIGELESSLSQFTGSSYCVSCASGSLALELILSAWGVGAGDAVLTTPFSFIATAEAIVRVGATPIFIDIDPETYNLNPDHLEKALEALAKADADIYPLPKVCMQSNLRPRVIATVDLFGNPADYDNILGIAAQHNLLTLEDGAQGFGSEYHGKRLCNCGCTAAATSFFPAKPLGCYGDGGAIFTNDGELAAILDSLRYHGRVDAAHKNDNVLIGCNGRMDTLQAAILLAKLEVFHGELESRAKIGQRYLDMLGEIVPEIGLPRIMPGGKSNWAQFTIRLPEGVDRSKVMKNLAARGIPTSINYPKSMHMQKSMAFLGYNPHDFPNALHAAERVLSLPMHPYLTENEQDEIISALANACREGR